jgi:hypothetical protein
MWTFKLTVIPEMHSKKKNIMKKINQLLAVIVAVAMMTACTDDFAAINENPAQINDPNPAHLFTESIYQMNHYTYTEWFYDNYNYFWRWNQSTVSINGNEPQFNEVGAVGGRYDNTYTISRNLDEIRRIIDNMDAEDQEIRTHMRAITYIPSVYQAIRASDLYGDMPWSEAMEGRYENHYTPAYDPQSQLYEQWLSELDSAIEVLISDDSGQLDFGNQDFIYGGNSMSWARMANSLKLRIAVRVEGQDPQWAQQIIDDVLASPAGIIESAEDEFRWAPSGEYTGEAHDFWGEPSAAYNFINKLVELEDPRTHFYFEPNDFDQDAVNTFAEEGNSLPDWIDPDEPVDRWAQYRGGPVSPTLANTLPYYGSYTDNSGSGYAQLSHVNRRFFNPAYDGGSGYYKDALLSAAEVALYMAEFIEKGYVTGHGTSEEWYERGVRASVETSDRIAEVAQVSDYSQVQATESQINDYLALDDVALNGINNLEKIYFQQYINFFRYPTEQFALTRRTGFPGADGNILAWEPPISGGSELPLPRRFPVNEPSNPQNIENFQAAMQNMGWSVGANSGSVLNQERVWWDEGNPNFGTGSFD